MDTTRQKATQRSKEHRKKTQQKKDKSKEKESGARETEAKKKNVETEEKSKISKQSEPVKKNGNIEDNKKLSTGVVAEPPAPPPAAPPSPPPAPPPPPPLPASPGHSSVTTSKNLTKQSNSSPRLRSSSPDSSSTCPQAVHGVIQPFQVKSRSSHDPPPSRQQPNTRKRIESDLSDDDFTEEVPVKNKIQVAPEKPARPKEKGEFRKRETLTSQSSETSSEGDRNRKPSAPSDDESTDKSKKLPRRYQIDEQGPRPGRRESREYPRRRSPSPPRRRQPIHSPPRDRLPRWKHSPPLHHFSRSPPIRRSRSPPPLHRRSPLYRRSRSPPLHRRSRSPPLHRRSRSPLARRFTIKSAHREGAH